jgi:pyridoxal phosphate enzyme (YggS family)
MAELIDGLDLASITNARQRVEVEIAAACQRAGRRRDDVEVLLAAKYVPIDESRLLDEAGVTLLGENRAQDLLARIDAFPGVFTYDFIGRLQSRKVKQIVPHVRLIHSVATNSVLAQLEAHHRPDTKVLVQVNLDGDPEKEGVSPDALDEFIARCPVPVVGLSTMPALTADAESNRSGFRTLRDLAEERQLEQLSMGTSQDFSVAIEEGATIVRIGNRLLI